MCFCRSEVPRCVVRFGDHNIGLRTKKVIGKISLVKARPLRFVVCLSAVLLIGSHGVATLDTADTDGGKLGLGEPIDIVAAEHRRRTVFPSGNGLPSGSGSAAQGSAIYAVQCASCHGQRLEGTPAGLALVGGRGSLATDNPKKTVESYWPYATSLFSYVRETMPPVAPGSLSADDTYAVVAFILSEAKVIDPQRVMDAQSLPQVEMPNRYGFIADPRPDVENSTDTLDD